MVEEERERNFPDPFPFEQMFLSFLALSKYFTKLFALLVSGEVTFFFVPGIKNKLTMPLASNTNDFVNAKSQAREKPLLTGYFSLAFFHTLPNLALCNLPFLSSF